MNKNRNIYFKQQYFTILLFIMFVCTVLLYCVFTMVIETIIQYNAKKKNTVLLYCLKSLIEPFT